jgi:hypothetical protein
MFNCELSAPAIVPLLQEICYLIYSSFIPHRTLHCCFIMTRKLVWNNRRHITHRSRPRSNGLLNVVIHKKPILMFTSDFSQALTGAGIRTNFYTSRFLSNLPLQKGRSNLTYLVRVRFQEGGGVFLYIPSVSF